MFTNNGVQCGTGNRLVNNPIGSVYTNPYPPAYNYSLKRGAAAIGLVPNRLPHPRTDTDSKLRPLRSKLDAGADQWDPVLIVFGRSIGAVRIGEPLADVEAFYGRPRARGVLKLGKRSLDRLTFRLHGGSLWAIADRGRVVGVGTTSPYYTTTGGIGVTAGRLTDPLYDGNDVDRLPSGLPPLLRWRGGLCSDHWRETGEEDRVISDGSGCVRV